MLLQFGVDTVEMRASLTIDIIPGPLARIDTVRIDVEPAEGAAQEISDRVVRRVLGLDENAIYRERDLINAQRNLYQLDAYRHVEVRLAPDTGAGERVDSLVAVDVSLIEGDMHAARVGFGWATLDCFRAQGEYTDRNFLGGGRRLELSTRLSKLGAVEPVSFARDGLCGALEDDPFSEQLNYFAGATFRQPTFFGLGPRTVPTVTLYSERRSEYKVFLRSTPIGGLVTLTREPWRLTQVTLSYQVELGRTEAEPALFCAVFTVCDLSDQEQLEQDKRIAIVGASFVRNATDNLFNPSRGALYRLELRHASPGVASSSDLRFNKFVGDAAWYWSVGEASVLAARVRVGGVLDATLSLDGASEFIPPQERLYAGGPNTVRGFHQNELGPVVYVVDTFTVVNESGQTYYRVDPDSATPARAVPTGGNSLVVANLEYRMPGFIFPDLIQWTAFMDVGELWNRGGERGIDFRQLKWTPGAGLRIFTAVGAIRVDVGYNPYDRPAGAAYYDAVPDELGFAPLYCVSPGNSLVVTDGDPPVQERGPCPGTDDGGAFTPSGRTSFFDRLTFNFSLGQAF